MDKADEIAFKRYRSVVGGMLFALMRDVAGRAGLPFAYSGKIDFMDGFWDASTISGQVQRQSLSVKPPIGDERQVEVTIGATKEFKPVLIILSSQQGDAQSVTATGDAAIDFETLREALAPLWPA